MLIAFYSMGFAEKCKAQVTMNSKIQKYVLNKHISYVLSCVLAWMAFLSSYYYLLFRVSIPQFDYYNI
jgi:hypothetical protein